MLGDISCVRCEYNLRGLSARGRCPECGTPIFRSLPTGDALSPHQMKRISEGLGVMLWAAPLTATAAGLIIGGLVFDSPTRMSPQIGPVIGWCLLPIAAAVRAHGAFVVTNPDVLTKPYDHVADTRTAIRVTAVLSLILISLGGLLQVAAQLSRGTRIDGRLLTGGWTCVTLAFLASSIGAVAFMATAESIADRIGAKQVQKSTRAAALIGVLACTGGVFVFFLGPVLAWVVYQVSTHQLLRALRARVSAS